MRTLQSKSTCARKVKHATFINAQAQANLMAAKYNDEFVAYLCKFGTHYHVGHSTPMRQAIMNECMAIYNRGFQAGQNGETPHLMNKAREYATKIMRIVERVK
jgi:hypothetical protein